jgi:hypothetical protein
MVLTGSSVCILITVTGILLPNILFLFLCRYIYEKFANAFSKAVQNLQVGDGFTEGVVQVAFVIVFCVRLLLWLPFWASLPPVICEATLYFMLSLVTK